MKKRELAERDVVRIITGPLKGNTGVINRIENDQVNVFIKDTYIGIWFEIKELQRIGKIK